jgi:hypothetical protein
MASFGQALARQADVGEIESVDRTRRIGRREAELSPRHGSRRKKINLAKSSSGGLPPLDGLCAFPKYRLMNFATVRVYDLFVILRAAARPCRRLLASFFPA